MSKNLLKAWPWVLGSLMLAVGSQARQVPSAQAPKPIAIVAGQPIYEKDLAPSIGGDLRQLQGQIYELKANALEHLIEQKVLEAAAKKKGVTVQKLLDQEVDAKVSQPSDAEVRAYYLGMQGRQSRPFDEIKGQLRTALRQVEIQRARAAYLKSLREQAAVEVFLSPPRAKVSFDPHRLRGSAHAPVMIIEFSDYQCPFCRREEAVLDGLLARYGAKVSLAYRDYPLQSIHPHAEMAAEASRCAGAQGKFWAYHDRLFTDPPQLERGDLLNDAKGLGLDEKSFTACLDNHQFKSQVAADQQDGTSLGVNGTPSFFINGVFLSGAQPAEAFEKIIDEELTRKGISIPPQSATASPGD